MQQCNFTPFRNKDFRSVSLWVIAPLWFKQAKRTFKAMETQGRLRLAGEGDNPGQVHTLSNHRGAMSHREETQPRGGGYGEWRIVNAAHQGS
jgi:hypothetical protein